MLLHHCIFSLNSLRSFISGTSNVVFEIVFCSNIAASKTSFWAHPLKTDHKKLNACVVCSLEAHLEVFFLAASLKKRISTLITTGKQLEVLKVRQISVYALTVRWSLWVSDLVHEVRVRQKRLRGKEEWNRGRWVRYIWLCWYVLLSSDDTERYSFTS